MTLLMAGVGQAQNPGTKEDEAIERQKILRAADQIDALVEQVNRLEQTVQSLKQSLADMHTENDNLKKEIAQVEADRKKDRETIVSEVARTVAQVGQPSVSLRTDVDTKAPEKIKEKESDKKGTEEKGYWHTVEKGQTLWVIAKAYQSHGVKVSVDDIRKANHLGASDSLKVGQKLFVPQKD